MVMHADAIRLPVTLAQYLAFEESAEEKHILWDGQIDPMWGMAGGSPAHNTISANAVAAALTRLRGGPCRTFTSGQKVWVPLKNGVVYPDVTIVCAGLSLHDATTDVVENPVVIVEVLSPGTESFDRAEKFMGYRTIPTLRHYVMVSSKEARVEHYERADDGAWTYRELRTGDTLALTSPALELPVDELYERAFDATG